MEGSDPGAITVTIIPVSGAQYSFDGGSSFTDDNTKGGLTANTTINLAIRMKETDTHNVSEAAKLAITLTAYDITVTDGSASVNGKAVTKGYPGQTVTVTAASRSGYKVSGWRVTGGDVTLIVSADKKTATFTMPEEAVSLRAEYQKEESSSGSSSGGSSSSSSSATAGTGNVTGNTGSIGAISPIAGIGDLAGAGLTGTTGTGTGMNTGADTGAAGTGGIMTGIPADGMADSITTDPGAAGNEAAAPFIRGEDGTEGWEAIEAEISTAVADAFGTQSDAAIGIGESISLTVDMNGTTVVPGSVFDTMRGKDITVVFDLGNGMIWSVNGKSITADHVKEIDFAVTRDTKAIPADILNHVTGERYSTQITLAYDGEFGFTAVLCVNLDASNAGLFANLFYYDEAAGELEFICADEIAEDGTAELTFTHASDYVVIVDPDPMDGSASGTDTSSDDSQTDMQTPEADTGSPWWLIVIGAVVIAAGFGGFFILRKKKSGDE